MVTQEQLSQYTVKMRGGRPYLNVQGRLLLFRDRHPDWCIATEAHEINVERGYAVFRATIMDETGRVIATATNLCRAQEFPDFVEKAETSAVGRALVLAGFGADAAGYDLDEGERLADSPAPPAPARRENWR